MAQKDLGTNPGTGNPGGDYGRRPCHWDGAARPGKGCGTAKRQDRPDDRNQADPPMVPTMTIGTLFSRGPLKATSAPAASSQVRVGRENSAHAWLEWVRATETARDPAATARTTRSVVCRDGRRRLQVPAATNTSSGQKTENCTVLQARASRNAGTVTEAEPRSGSGLQGSESVVAHIQGAGHSALPHRCGLQRRQAPNRRHHADNRLRSRLAFPRSSSTTRVTSNRGRSVFRRVTQDHGTAMHPPTPSNQLLGVHRGPDEGRYCREVDQFRGHLLRAVRELRLIPQTKIR